MELDQPIGNHTPAGGKVYQPAIDSYHTGNREKVPLGGKT